MAKFETLEIAGWESAIYGMRNPLKSWNKSDSYINLEDEFIIGKNDYKLIQSLINAGTEHRKFLRQIQVWVSIDAPRFFWNEWDTYKIGTSANSTSTMHTLLNEELTEENFEWPSFDNADWDIQAAFRDYINTLNTILDRAKQEPTLQSYYLNIIKSMLPESFLQTRTINLNYEVLNNMYHQRKNHRLPQWREDFVSWVNTLPYNEFITGIWPNEK